MKEQKRQTFRSEYGRKGIRVSGPTPTYAIRRKLAHVHVGTSDADVARMVADAIEAQIDQGAEGWTPELVRDTHRFALWQHAENRAEYAYVMS